MGCAPETCEEYEVASGPSPVEHLELYIWLNVDELGFERSPALRRGTVLAKSGAGYQGKDSHPNLLTHLHPLHLYCLAILPHQGLPVSVQTPIEGWGLDSWRNISIALIVPGPGVLSEMAFHEKAGRSQVIFLVFIGKKFFSPAESATVAMLPSALSRSDSFRSVHVGRSRFSRCCHLFSALWFGSFRVEPGPGH